MWHATNPALWSGRDDSQESPLAKRVFQTIHCINEFSPALSNDAIALLGFLSDEGVKRNQGRVGAAEAPPVIRKALANLASYDCRYPLLDYGDISYPDDNLEAGQRAFSDAIQTIHQHGGKTLVFGGGHETAFAHGKGLFDAYPTREISIINFDPHLDLRRHQQATSGTPFAQLAETAKQHNKPFHYTCVGASKANNTAALIADAESLGVNVFWDTEVNWHQVEKLQTKLRELTTTAELIYLTIDLDVLPSTQMPSVSAPAALGIPFELLLHLATPIMQSGKVIGADLAEFNPQYDSNGQGARVAGRLAWELWQNWA